MIMEKTLGRNSGIDVLKTFCILFVVILHTELLAPVFGGNLESLCRFATPVFFIITGYFYSSTVKRGKAVSHIKRVIVLILVANAVFIAINAVYCVCANESLAEWLASMFTKKKLFDFVFFNSSFVTGHFASFHLWYLYALLYVLIIANVLRKFGLFRVLYFLTPVLLIGGLVAECFSTQIFGVNFSNSQGYCYYRNFLTVGIPYFCIGSILNRYAAKIRIKSIVLLLAFVFLQALSVLEMIIAKKVSHASSIDFFISTPLCAACAFLLFSNLFESRGVNKFCAALSEVGRNDVVWIYIYHLPIMVLVRDCLPQTGSSFADKALVTVLTLALSLTAAAAIDKTKRFVKSKRLKKQK